ncbi:FtsX-like permease family protein [Flavihumibacter sp. R14]|nr:FtsX-like permease family protein [Flavihumibacter soli]
MFRNYFKIALRNLMKYKFISFINLFGLSVGLACCLLIFTYIRYEVSFDRFHKNADNIYRVQRTFNDPETGNMSLELGAVAPPFATLLENDFKDIKNITRFIPNGPTPLRYDDKMFNQDDVYWADERLFEIFSFDVSKGNPSTALKEPFSVMLTEEAAKKYFGGSDPMDKMIRMNNQFNFKVTGVFKPLPGNSHFHPEVMVSFSTLRDSAIYGEEQLRTNFGNNSFYTYLVLPEGSDPKRLEAQFPAFLNRHINDGGPYKASQYTALQLIKLTDIHLTSHRDDEIEENGDIKRVYIFSAIALFILLIACINYMNLSTARSVLRAKEIGIRKVVGAGKNELITQFLCESVVICWIAAIMAFIFTWIALPWLNSVSGQQLSGDALFQWNVLALILIFPFLVGIIAGIYPALFLSSFQPVRVLSGSLKVGGKSISFRQVLVVLQFSISIMLIICTAVVYQQLKYMQGKSLGFEKEHIITLNNNVALNENYTAFRNTLLADPNIKNAGRSSRIPSGRLLDASGSQISRGDSLAPTKADIKVVSVDEDFIPTYGITMLEGRNFRKNSAADTSSYLINEAAVRVLGLKSSQDAIGMAFQYGGRKGQLTGVFNDFHFESLHQRILPIVFRQSVGTDGYGNISVKVSGTNVPAALAHIESTWKKFLPEIPFEYRFLDENFEELYRAEMRQGSVFTIFTGIAIFIACLGLFGLSAFTITQRIKEIGIRKVLGASVKDIVFILSKDFMKLVLIAAIIAFPVAWYAMHNWLADFAYRIDISWGVFILAGIIAAIVAFATISLQAIKAAVANPVKSLRTE